MKQRLKLALCILTALPLLAAGNTPHLRGQVLDIGGTHQVAHAIVTMTNANGYIASLETNQKGEFNFAALPEGEYNFRVTAPGFAIYERDLTVSSAALPQQLSVRMLVRKDHQTVSVADLLAAAPANSLDSARRGF